MNSEAFRISPPSLRSGRSETKKLQTASVNQLRQYDHLLRDLALEMRNLYGMKDWAELD